MVGKKKESYAIEGRAWDIENTPWGNQAEYLTRQGGRSFADMRDAVILLYLKEGDKRPLVDLLRGGVAPGAGVLRYLAGMVGETLHDKHLDLPFELLIKGRNDNKKKDGTLQWRDHWLNDHVEKQMAQGSKYEFATNDVAESFNVSHQTVRDAYDKYHPKDTKGN